MKQQQIYSLFTLLLFTLLQYSQLHAQCQITTLPYGQVQTDINRGYKIIPTQSGDFIIAGEWNNEAYLMKVNSQGVQLTLKKYGAAIGGQSKFVDIVEASDGGFVAVGQCDNCTIPNDSLVKVIAIKTDQNLNMDATIGVKKFGSVTEGNFTTRNERFSPSLVRSGNTYTMAAAVNVGAGLNPENVVVTKLTASLQPVWDKMYNTGFFESPFDIVATEDGFIMPVNRAFVPTAILLKIDLDGNMLWTRPFAANVVRNIEYLPATQEAVIVGDRFSTANNQDAFLMVFNATTGAPVDSLLWGDMLTDEGWDVRLLGNGDLQVATRSNQPNPFGIYATSRVYRVQTHPLHVRCYEVIPNPDNITNMSVSSVAPLSENGKDFVATGIRGFYNRTFFHIQHGCEMIQVTATICPGSTYTLPDGMVVSQAGIYTTTTSSATGCGMVTQTTLSVYPLIAPTTLQVSLCAGETYTLPNGATVSSSGTYNTALNSVQGCDSLIVTILDINTPITVDSADIHHDTGSGNGTISLTEIYGGTMPYTFQWSNNATGNTIENLTPGVYLVTVTDALGCTAIAEFTIDMQVATVDLQQEQVFMLYPNPFVANLQVVLEWEHSGHTRYDLRLTDAQGKICRSYRLQQGTAELLDTGTLPAGVYWVQLLENNQVVRQSKVVKQ